MENIMDLTFLTEKERQLILEVLNRDDEVRQKEESRIERLKNKAARTNNPTIQKKIKMRTGEWFWELAEKQGSLKRNGTVNASVRASLRLKPKSRPPLKGSPPIVEIEAVSDPEQYAEKPLDEDHLSDNVHYLNDASGGEEGYMTIDNKVEAANQTQEIEVTIDSPFSSDSDNDDRGIPVIASANVHAPSSFTEGESHELPQQNDASSSEDELMQNFVNPGHVADAMRHDFHVLTHNDDEGRQVSSSEENLPHSDEEKTSRDEDSLRSNSVEIVVVDVPVDAGATSTTGSSSTTSNQLKPDEDHPANHTLAEEQVTAPDVVEDEEDEDTKILNELDKAMTSPAYLDAKNDNEPTVICSEEANKNDSLTSSHPEGDEKDEQECKDEEQENSHVSQSREDQSENVSHENAAMFVEYKEPDSPKDSHDISMDEAIINYQSDHEMSMDDSKTAEIEEINISDVCVESSSDDSGLLQAGLKESKVVLPDSPCSIPQIVITDTDPISSEEESFDDDLEFSEDDDYDLTEPNEVKQPNKNVEAFNEISDELIETTEQDESKVESQPLHHRDEATTEQDESEVESQPLHHHDEATTEQDESEVESQPPHHRDEATTEQDESEVDSQPPHHHDEATTEQDESEVESQPPHHHDEATTEQDESEVESQHPHHHDEDTTEQDESEVELQPPHHHDEATTEQDESEVDSQPPHHHDEATTEQDESEVESQPPHHHDEATTEQDESEVESQPSHHRDEATTEQDESEVESQPPHHRDEATTEQDESEVESQPPHHHDEATTEQDESEVESQPPHHRDEATTEQDESEVESQPPHHHDEATTEQDESEVESHPPHHHDEATTEQDESEVESQPPHHRDEATTEQDESEVESQPPHHHDEATTEQDESEVESHPSHHHDEATTEQDESEVESHPSHHHDEDTTEQDESEVELQPPHHHDEATTEQDASDESSPCKDEIKELMILEEGHTSNVKEVDNLGEAPCGAADEDDLDSSHEEIPSQENEFEASSDNQPVAIVDENATTVVENKEPDSPRDIHDVSMDEVVIDKNSDHEMSMDEGKTADIVETEINISNVRVESSLDDEIPASSSAQADLKEIVSDECTKQDPLVASCQSNLQDLYGTGPGSGPGKKKKKGLLGGSTPNLNAISITKPSFGSSWSVYSTTSGVVRDDIDVSGSVEIGLDYSYSTGTLNVHVGSCHTLAAAEGKKLSNPYVKTYLLPDKNSKRKTKAKKKTVNPSFNETLKYVIPESELATRTLNVAVWHDKVGVNVFLGEVNITLDLFDSSAPNKMEEYQLLPRGARVEESLSNYMGDVDVALRLSSSTQQDAFNEGQLEIVLKNVKNVKPSKANGMCSVYVKGYFLPDPSQVTKQKTPVMTGTGSIVFDHLFVYTNVQVAELQQRCLELSVWQYEKYTANKLIGGVRLGTGTGESFNVKVPWMDSHNAEVSLWKRMLRHTGSWVEEQVPLRVVEPWK
ncbi:uncharacterized protein LOC143465818 isoform X3 [Clavelina lepadiformis]|uniref:uncharacterized protein LOC143465818 isoform X3 n=1 Tax=Clavelina lepadiformis TaxID=159417 RepID=UPI004043149E